jgi:murein L,D-transpeptidase YcbB/YkuD
MKPLVIILGFAACLSVALTAGRAEEHAPPGPASADLQVRLMSGVAAGERLLALEALRLFYVDRSQRLAWSDAGILSPQIDVLLAALRGADREGLRPADYHTAAIDALRERLRPRGRGVDPPASGAAAAAAGDLDLLLSDAFFLYASHLTAGRVNPESVEPEWNVVGRGRDLVFLLTTALEHGHLADTIGALPPVRDDYRRLRDALASLRATAAAGGWPLVPPGPTLREGERGPRVQALRRRLAASGELPAGGDTGGDLFDAPLADALRHFQPRHGLDADAIAGRRTLAALNTPASRRAQQIEANLERTRWLPRDLGPRHLMVNIADFRLVLTEPGRPPLEMRVIAGRLARRTPFFSGEITSIRFNPSWTVPEKIAIEDKLPLILADRFYLYDNGFKLYAPSGKGWREIDPADVDWTRLSKTNFPYRLRQEPGPDNALGRIKFQVPNRHDIYLHDTPSHSLFARAERAFSSGCIRVERALELAERLLAADPAWTRARIEETIAAGSTVNVRLPEPLPVYLFYWTAWVDRDGALQLREDLYGRDDALLAALSQPVPAHSK